MIQFDEHIFQMGWFNHQLVSILLILLFGGRWFLLVGDVMLDLVRLVYYTYIYVLYT